MTKYLITFQDYEVKYQDVFYRIKVMDRETFNDWEISVNLENLEEMHEKLQLENSQQTLPDFPRHNILYKMMNSWLFRNTSDEEIRKKQGELEHYMKLMMGPKRPSRVMTLNHFLKNGSFVNFNCDPNSTFELAHVRQREDLYKIFIKGKLVHQSQFVKVYVLQRKVTEKINGVQYLYYILKRMAFDSPEQKISPSEAFIQQEISSSKKIYEIVQVVHNNHKTNSHVFCGRVLSIFQQNSKTNAHKKSPRPRCWVVHEYFKQTLKNRFDKSRKNVTYFTRGFIFDTLSQCARAMFQLQEQKIYHRNIKASNIIILDDDSIKIIDTSEPVYKLKDQLMVNNNAPELCYHPPEKQIQKQEKKANFPTMPDKQDVWSLGVMFIGLCTLQSDSELRTLHNPEPQCDIYLSDLLSQVSERYGRPMAGLLSKMVCRSQDFRSDFKSLMDELNDGRLIQLETRQLNQQFIGLNIQKIMLIKSLDQKFLQSISYTKNSKVLLNLHNQTLNHKDLIQSLNTLHTIFEKGTHINIILSKSNINDQMFIDLINCIQIINEQQRVIIIDMKNTELSNISLLKVLDMSKLLKHIQFTVDINGCPQINWMSVMSISKELLETSSKLKVYGNNEILVGKLQSSQFRSQSTNSLQS